MYIQQLRVKLLSRADEFDRADLIPIFHRWIRESRLGPELLIDVADYRHVPDGPGVMLIGDEGHYSFDRLGGQPGLSYARKRDQVGDIAAKLSEALGRALAAAEALAGEPSLAGKLALSADRLEIQVMNRLIAPNTAATYDQLRSHLADFLAPLYPGRDVELGHLGEGKHPLGASVTVTGGDDTSVTDVLARLRAG